MIRAIFAFSAPAVIVIAALAAFERVSPADAALAAAVAAIVIAWLVRRHVTDIRALGAYIEDLAQERDAAPPSLRAPELLSDLPAAMRRLQLSWNRGHASLAQTAAAAETILDYLPGPLIVLDSQRRVVRASARARELLGIDMVGRDLAAALRDPDVLEAADRVLAGDGDEDVAFSVPFPVERTFSARIVRLPVPTADGTEAIVTLYDLTAIMRAEQTRVDFVANASHELRTPLSVLLGCIKTLRGSAREDKEAQARFLDMMEAQADRMSRLVDDLLSLSHIELNEHTAPTDTIDVARLIRKVADSLEFPTSERGIQIAVEPTLDVQPVAGDAEELTQLFQNLIDNAIKYGRDNSTVHVELRMAENGPDGDIVEIAIRDEGEGIPAAHVPRLTERFYRVDTARSRELGGTGLGLAIVKHVLNRHRGTLDIASEVGRGSTFTVRLPGAGDGKRRDLRQAGLPLGPGAVS